jgi:predicted Ser/Thr protein kinase
MSVNGINRENLEARKIEEIRRGRPWEPDILLVRGDTQPCVIKDYRRRPFLYREGVGVLSVWNEARMYGKLSGVSGIPRCYGRLDRHAIAIEYISGRNASKVKPDELPPEFFASLQAIVNRVHEKGIVLCDLRNRKNVMVSDDLQPYLIDLCTAFERGSRWNILRRLAFNAFFEDDLMGVAKLKKKLRPELLTAAEADRLRNGLFMEKEIVAVRNFCVRWLKKMVASH